MNKLEMKGDLTMNQLKKENVQFPIENEFPSNPALVRLDDYTFRDYLHNKGLDADTCSFHVQFFFVFMATIPFHTITINNLKISIRKYKEHLDRVIISRRDFVSKRNELLKCLTYYIQYLFEIKKIDVRPDFSLVQFSDPIFDDLGCQYFRDYIRSFIKRGYSYVSDKINSIRHFLKRIPIPPCKVEKLTLEHVKNYEKIYFAERVSREEITVQTARRQLDRVKRFLNYLRDTKVIRFSYTLTCDFVDTGSRDNEYVKSEYLIKFYNTILHCNTLTSEKYLCIFLLLIETGCRPIEICNLRYSDFHETESLISLHCIKSDRRQLKIDPYIKQFVINYIHKQRKCLLPNEFIFVDEGGTPLVTKDISETIRRYNYLTFGQIVFSAKSLRHTFITNALDEKNDFDKVSKTVGHKDWRATMHYLHRSVKRMLDNTLPFNPNTRSY
ncbi:tyrosine-type recombinase/integrase [Paenibacillus sp. GCM10023248]|uniref:tyrosine-type recombinase/integrase n=1 Tax=unclassified Paenibacillus TaxID=185978 RepID=UPI00237853BE|nr:site-specific integrase [Paenibacillus sp. MAHUQ-63]MDD9271456.1 site-specific integrase [Paenibacillus sp. MAHUQ-63]